MKQISIKIISFTMALLVLISTFSFTVEKHYCGGFLVDVSYVSEAQGCGMKMEEKAVSKKKSCCKDEVHKIEGQDELQPHSLTDFNFEKQQFLATFIVSYKDLFITNEFKRTHYKDFSPPDIPIDYQVLYASFLI